MKLIRNIGLYLGHLLTALIGTAILTTGIAKMFHATSIVGVIRKEWLLSILFAGLLGFLAYRISRSKIGAWIWTLPSAWFAMGILLLLPSLRAQSALSPNGSLWHQISGLSCVGGLREIGCRQFFLFTIPFIRSVAYSVGVLIGVHVLSPLTTQIPDSEKQRAKGEERPLADG